MNVTENSLADTLAGAQEFFALGADAIAALPPFYFPPRPAELTAWFRALLDASPGPVLHVQHSHDHARLDPAGGHR